MIFKMIAQVEADAINKQILGNKISTEFKDFTIRFCFKDGLLNQIIIEKRMPANEAFEQMALFLPVEKPEGMRAIIQEAKDILRYLESLGSFWFSIRSIDIANVNIHWEPERFTENFIRMRFETNFRSELGQSKMITVVDREQLDNMLSLRDSLQELLIPMSFYREGINEYSKERFGNSFINFFLMIEGLFGKGKSNPDKLQRVFMKSDELLSAIEECLPQEVHTEADNESLDHWLNHYGCSRTIEGIVKMFIKCRGNLHHYSINSTQKQGTPLNQDEYKSLAFFIRMVCMGIYMRLHGKYTETSIGLINYGTVKRPANEPLIVLCHICNSCFSWFQSSPVGVTIE